MHFHIPISVGSPWKLLPDERSRSGWRIQSMARIHSALPAILRISWNMRLIPNTGRSLGKSSGNGMTSCARGQPSKLSSEKGGTGIGFAISKVYLLARASALSGGNAKPREAKGWSNLACNCGSLSFQYFPWVTVVDLWLLVYPLLTSP